MTLLCVSLAPALILWAIPTVAAPPSGWPMVPTAGLRAGAAPTPTEPPFTTVRGTFFALSVADIDASAKWYSEKLGLKVVMEKSKYEKATVIVLDGAGLTVELVQHDDAAAAPRPTPLVRGIFKVGVVVDDLDKALASLKERHVPIFLGPYPAQGNTKSNFVIKDNAGNLIQFFGN